MRIIGTVALVLIAGILRSINAQSRSDPTRLSCGESRGPMENLKNCLRPVITEIRKARSGVSRFDALIAMSCRRTEIVDSCFKSYRISSKLCPRSDDHVFVDLINKVTISALRFLCAHSELIKDIWNTTDQRCISLHLLFLLFFCPRKISTDYYTTIPDHPVSEFNPPELDTEFYNNRVCSNILAAEQCGVDLFEGCGDKRFLTSLDSLLKYINDDIPCENLPKSPKSQVSPGVSAFDVV